MSHLQNLNQRECTIAMLDEAGKVAHSQAITVQVYVEGLRQGISMEMVEIAGGIFHMGSPDGQGYRDELPQHQVKISPYLIGRYPITQVQWQSVMGRHIGRFTGDHLPVENVSWLEATRFCKRLTKLTRREYHLPSEAQWEYACRAGSTTAFSYGRTLSTDVANYNGEFTYLGGPKGMYRHTTTNAGSFPANAFGLCDMHGNVWEWCGDVWHDSYDGAPTVGSAWQRGGDILYRVARGGCWHDTPDVCRSTTRLKLRSDEGDEFTGFRVVLAPEFVKR
jgi:eukaryotic-like serine/threonine-protein kinase